MHSLARKGELLSELTSPDILLPMGVILLLIVIIVPLPTLALDLLISLNIALSIVMLLVAMYVLDPVDFSVFPPLLLLLTLFRLSLNIASTRLILLQGGEGTAAAGRVIQAFGQFVIGGNYLVGVVIFLLLIAIQYIVINHGAVRVSEVAARFTLDAMPGKQMAIDADLNAGIIDEKEARSRRERIAREADFYGAMDGAIRFTQRDAVAGLIIIVINIAGGLIVGLLQQGLSLAEALSSYTILTVGDGLVTAIPSLLVSTAGGIVTTRAASESSLGSEVSKQLFKNHKPVLLGTSTLALLALVPGLPKVSFLLLAALLGGAAYLSYRQSEAGSAGRAEAAAPRAGAPEKIEALLKVSPLSVELGYGLISLAEAGREGNILDKIKFIRRQLALELGIVVPPVHVVDNLQLKPRQYAILLRGVQVASGELWPDHALAINPGEAHGEIDGIPTREPTWGLPALWIRPADREKAQSLGYTVIEPTTVFCTHLGEVIKAHAHELLGRQETKTLLDYLAESHPKLVEEVVPKALSVGEVQKVLQNLLRERVSIRDLVTILEALADYSPMTKNTSLLTEYARQALGRAICKQYQNEAGELAVLTLSPDLERTLTEALTRAGQGAPALDPRLAREIINRIKAAVEKSANRNTPVLLAPLVIRAYLRQLLERELPNLAVLSHQEVPAGINVVSLGMIS